MIPKTGSKRKDSSDHVTTGEKRGRVAQDQSPVTPRAVSKVPVTPPTLRALHAAAPSVKRSPWKTITTFPLALNGVILDYLVPPSPMNAKWAERGVKHWHSAAIEAFEELIDQGSQAEAELTDLVSKCPPLLQDSLYATAMYYEPYTKADVPEGMISPAVQAAAAGFDPAEADAFPAGWKNDREFLSEVAKRCPWFLERLDNPVQAMRDHLPSVIKGLCEGLLKGSSIPDAIRQDVTANLVRDRKWSALSEMLEEYDHFTEVSMSITQALQEEPVEDARTIVDRLVTKTPIKVLSLVEDGLSLDRVPPERLTQACFEAAMQGVTNRPQWKTADTGAKITLVRTEMANVPDPSKAAACTTDVPLSLYILAFGSEPWFRSGRVVENYLRQYAREITQAPEALLHLPEAMKLVDGGELDFCRRAFSAAVKKQRPALLLVQLVESMPLARREGFYDRLQEHRPNWFAELPMQNRTGGRFTEAIRRSSLPMDAARQTWSEGDVNRLTQDAVGPEMAKALLSGEPGEGAG